MTYGVLTYRGDVTELGRRVDVPATGRTVPVLLGTDALGAPYEVLDVELLPAAGEAGLKRTRVHLGPADVATQRGNKSRHLAQLAAAAPQRAQEARVRHFWRPDLWPAPKAVGVEATA